MFVAVIGILITLPALKSIGGVPIAFYAVVSVAVIGLYLAFLIPIYLRWRIGDAFEEGSWTNGKKYKWMNPLAVAEIAIISVYFILPFTPAGVPFSDEFAWSSVNYAPVLTIGDPAGPGGVVEGVGQEVVHRARRARSTRRSSRRSTTDPRTPHDDMRRTPGRSTRGPSSRGAEMKKRPRGAGAFSVSEGGLEPPRPNTGTSTSS